MDSKDFLTDLDELMPDHSYKARWLKELDAHLDDFEEDLHREGRKLTPLTLTERMGTPKRILSDFYKTLHPWRLAYYLAEALFTGLLILVLTIGTSSLQWTMVNMVTVATGVSVQNPIVSLLEGLLALLFITAILYLSHSMSWKQAYFIKKDTGYSLIPWALITLTPALLAVGAWSARLIAFALEDAATCVDCEPFWWSISRWALSYGLFLTIYLGTAFLSYRKQTKIALKNLSAPLLKKAEKLFTVLLGMYLISYGILALISNYFLFAPVGGIFNILGAIYIPLFVAQWLILVIGTLILSQGDGIMSFPVLSIYLMGSILIFIIFQSLIHMLYNRKGSWPRIGLILCVLPVLFTNPDRYDPDIAFNKPSLIISNEIEKAETGPFYGLLKYMNQDEGRMFRYAVDYRDGEFILQQNSGYEFRFEAGEWTEETANTLIDQKIKIDDMIAETVTWPENFYCHTESVSEEGVEGIVTIIPSLQESNELAVCTELFFNNESIFESDYQKELKDVAFSDDGHWMLLVVGSGFYDPDYVYLIQL